MKFRKTAQNQRGTYKYEFTSKIGKCICELKPGENGLTDADIYQLHKIDDREVDHNSYWKPQLGWSEETKRTWKEEHPEEKLPSTTPLSLSYNFNQNQESDKQMLKDPFYQAPVFPEHFYDHLHELMGQLPEMQRRCLELEFAGYKNKEITEKLGLSKATVSEHLKKAKKFIKDHYLDNFEL